MKRNRRHWFSRSLLGCALVMFQLHIALGCCLLHHNHSGAHSDGPHQTIVHAAVHEEVNPVSLTAPSHSACGDDGEFCAVSSAGSDVSQRLIRLMNAAALGDSSVFSEIIPLADHKIGVTDLLPHASYENPLYLRYRSFLI